MNCRFHPKVEAVTRCSVCGAEMCSQCETNAFFQDESGVLCLDCSLKEAEQKLDYDKRRFKKLIRKLIFASIFIIAAIGQFIAGSSDDNGGMVFSGVVAWFLSGLIQTWGHEKDKTSVKSFIWGDPDKEEGTLQFFFKIIFYVFAAPVMLIRNFIKLFGIKRERTLDTLKYNEILSALDNLNYSDTSESNQSQNEYQGNSVSENDIEEWRNRAEQGDAEAQYKLGISYRDGKGVLRNLNNALSWWTKSAEQGYARAQYELGLYYHYNDDDKDYEKSAEWYRKAAEQGLDTAQYLLGLCYGIGEGVEQDYKKAFEWYKKSAEQGYAEAQNALGEYYYAGCGTEKDAEKAVTWWMKSAEQNYAEAQNALGVYYYEGCGTEKDTEKAVTWWMKSAEQNCAEAQFSLGLYYFDIQDYEKAFNWYEKSAAQGYARAQLNLGFMYFTIAEKDYKKSLFHKNKFSLEYVKAFELWIKAAEQGNILAQRNLGFCYYEGKGTVQNREKGIELLKKAAEQGDETAQQFIQKHS